MSRGFTYDNHGYWIEGEAWARDYRVECKCGWFEDGISSHSAAEDSGGAHLWENRDDKQWVD